MIDIHCHILPNMDDGPDSLEESLEMARQAVEDGIHTVVATPHTLNGIYSNTRSEVLERATAFESALSQNHIDLKLHPGSDVRLTAHMTDRVRAGDICTIGDRSRHLLLELPEHVLPQAAQNEIFSLKLSGITPIITHPERNASIQRNPGILRELIHLGALSQVTAMSLTGAFGLPAREVAGDLLKQRLLHIIASDAHSMDHRPVILSDAVAAAADILGSQEEAERMVTATPAAILAGQAPEIPEPVKPMRSWGFFRRFG